MVQVPSDVLDIIHRFQMASAWRLMFGSAAECRKSRSDANDSSRRADRIRLMRASGRNNVATGGRVTLEDLRDNNAAMCNQASADTYAQINDERNQVHHVMAFLHAHAPSLLDYVPGVGVFDADSSCDCPALAEEMIQLERHFNEIADAPNSPAELGPALE